MFEKVAGVKVLVGIQRLEIVEEWDFYLEIFVVTKTLQEVNALKEILGRRDQGIGTLSKDPISALDFKDLSLQLTKHKKTWVNLHCDQNYVMADIVEMNFYYKISFYKYMYKNNFT